MAALALLAGCVTTPGIRPLKPLEIPTAPYQEVVTSSLLGSLSYEGGCLLFHDEKATEPSLAYLLSRMTHPEFPEPIGVFRAVDAPRYEERLGEQIAAAQKRGKGDLKTLFTSGETWTVE